MTEFPRSPDPPGAPLDKILTESNLEKLQWRLQGVLSDQPTKDEVIRAILLEHENMIHYMDRHNRILEGWANTHRHKGLIGEDGELWIPGGEEGSVPGVDPNIPRVSINVGGRIYTWNFGDTEWVEFDSVSTTTLTGAAYYEGIDLASSRLIRLRDSTASTGGDWWMPGMSTWSGFPAGAPSGSSVRFAGITWYDGRIWLLGGKGSGTQTSYPHFRSLIPWEQDSWIFHPNYPKDIENSCIVWHGGILHVFGGRNASGNTTYLDHMIYDPSTDTWDSLSNSPSAFSTKIPVSIAGAIYIMNFQRTLYRWIDTDEWQVMAPIPSEVISSTLLADTLTNRVYFIGGRWGTSSTGFHIYNPSNDTWEEGPPLPAASAITAAGLIAQ